MVEQLQRVKPAGRASLLGACLFVLVLVAGMEIQKHREDARTPALVSHPLSQRIPEARLATIQLGRPATSTDTMVKRLAALLDLLAADCTGNSRSDLAGLTVGTLRALRSAGIVANPTEVLGGVVGMDDLGRLPRCRPYFERYAADRRQGTAPGKSK